MALAAEAQRPPTLGILVRTVAPGKPCAGLNPMSDPAGVDGSNLAHAIISLHVQGF
jgi:hypothetical protein